MSEEKPIPKGWVIERLGDFVIYQKGKKPKNVSNEKTEKCSIPYVNIKAFEKNIIDEYTDGIGCIFCEDGDFLMVWDGARSGYIGKAIKGALGSTLVKITFPGIVLNYAYYYLLSKYLQINTKAKGTGIPHVDPDLLWNYLFPIAPLPEQHRIVAKIEELFSSLDKGIESLKKAQEQLKIYRQAVLKWAFEGKLSETYREKYISTTASKDELKAIRTERENWFKSNGKKLKFEFELHDETLTDIPCAWEWVKIVETVFNTADDIVDGPFGSNLKNSDYVEGAPVPVISISNIEEGFDKKIRYITKDKFETIKRSAVYPGDIIVAKIGSTYGKTGFYPESMPIGVIPANLLRIHPSKHYNKKLLAYYLQSLVFKKRLDKIMKSTAQPAFNVSMFKELPIPFMSIKEQVYILSEIEKRLSVADKLEESIATAIQQAEALRQSILKKAFEGKLLSEAELEECRNDPNWEPASVLLERIASAKLSIKRAERHNKTSQDKNKPAKNRVKS